MDDLQNLLEAASKNDNLTNCDFDQFLKENNFSEDDLSERILMKDLYFFYSCWFYIKYKKLPHRYHFTKGSVVAKMYRIRQRRGTYLPWAIKCSKGMKDSFLKFMERSQKWQKKYDAIINAKKGHQARKINQKEAKQLEKLLTSQDLTRSSFLK